MPFTKLFLIGVALVLTGHLGNPGGVSGESSPLPSTLQPQVPAGPPAEARVLEEPTWLSVPFDRLHDVDLVALPFQQGSDDDSSFTVVPPEPVPEPPRTPVSAPMAAVERPSSATYQVEDNHQVRRFLDMFQTGHRRVLVEAWLARAGRYLPMILEVFQQKGLPEELVFTAMIESGFNPIAVSRAGAKGLWQFMEPTARRYGLRVDRWLDERLDPEKSTVAAANHLRDLYAVFGSWNLAKAAYNAGENKVLRAIRGMGTSDFWALARGRHLKEETKNFVPAIQAAGIIGREPDRYGFAVTPQDPLKYDVVQVPPSTALKRIADLSGLPLDELERLNTELRLKQTPPGGPYVLKVPVGGAERVQVALQREVASRTQVATGRGGQRTGQFRAATPPNAEFHVVKSRETLSAIAKRYGVSVPEITRWNRLGAMSQIRPGDRLQVASLAPTVEGQGGLR